METTKLSKAPPILFAIIGVLMLLLGLYFNLDWLDRLFKPPLFMYVANLMPGIAMIGTSLIINRIKRFRLQLIIIIFILIAPSLLGLAIVNGAVVFEQFAMPETEPAYYQDILELLEYGQRKWLKHFPPKIPENASNVSLYWSKGFMQSSLFLQLRLVLPSDEIKSLLDQSRARAAKTLDSKRSLRDLPPISSLYAGEVESLSDWPKDFEIIVFNYGKAGNANDEGYRTQEYWDIRYSYGVAISIKRNEIIYWSEEYPK